ncbi:MAG: DEAD/DEAH box helicase domain protein [Parcubacteria group bacterium GW2011_GWC2_44_17]|uniref:YprB ribonuclease H-like domain-containing protein n=1 Tax=Candidatus Jacksonbacteria bacterium RIFCSPLOWO2_02_FULL_44_20 TaxID=1798460 RepID=A0A1G2AAD3_9BACT|nr:MAG: DEAD/DEAH box helicase domain protein [Parcubacteria group bacterium GW2011_GWC2_44_17]KKT48236.1 MAG: DEAD/DEAH box helicase domain protein [Parcubacteria group bacterium GW2011_GWF2_44_17]OGY71669.1 MAG: hypothetical protein A3C00_00135 [Candidatus Jacksonbacteria bacterium RIFCSPHIGHO2_02_FULL_44_25]OGY72325.1 MAG: hypothetical protein A3E05_04445 [Candidatus Jacksonbacteria bacterium RIFCSPHIGHO2_12_FULL_44_12]OGY72990.1 MAG: hypothetical protein A3H61_04135 [Candidatus Jacksonbacte
MANKIVFDVETQKAFDEVPGRRPEKLGISIVVAYDYADRTYKSFREHELNRFFPLLESADLIIGFNHKNFDNKVLSAYYPGDLSVFPHLDLLEEFYKTAGFRVRLDDMAQATLGTKKTGTGLKAIEWYKNGDFVSLETYCRQDVLVTKDLYEYALANKKLKYKEITEIKEMPLDVSTWDRKATRAVNYTLPF